jgi:hypothetical protein
MLHPMKRLALCPMLVTAALAFAPPVHADVDTDFANQLHTFGIYGPKDYNAWLGKISCERLGRGTDPDVYASANFLKKNLPRNSTTGQTWQFLGAAMQTYCPEMLPRLQSIADQPNAAEQSSVGGPPMAAERG